MKKYFSVIAISALMLAAGCSAREEILLTSADGASQPAIDVYAETEIAWEENPVTEPVNLTSPPDMRIEAAGDGIASCMLMEKSGYEWGTEGSETIACGASPYQAWELGHIDAVIAFDEYTKNPTVLLSHGGEMDYVRCWSEYEYQAVQFTEEGEIFIQPFPVGSVYEVSVKFPQGRCSYLFATEKARITEDDVPSDGQTTPAYDPSAVQSSAAYNPDAELCGYPLAD